MDKNIFSLNVPVIELHDKMIKKLINKIAKTTTQASNGPTKPDVGISTEAIISISFSVLFILITLALIWLSYTKRLAGLMLIGQIMRIMTVMIEASESEQ